jgi:rhamnose transport system permease protein
LQTPVSPTSGPPSPNTPSTGSLETADARPSPASIGWHAASRIAIRLVARWETLLLVVLAGVMIYNAHLSPYFLDTSNLLDDTSNFAAIGIVALPMTLIIIAGQIDLSVGSNAVLCSTVFATLWQHGWNVWLACVGALVIGTLAGAGNGLVVTRFRLPSLVVTLGTYALFRGIATGILGNSSGITGFPDAFAGIDTRYLQGTSIPAPLVIFALLAVLMAVLLNATVFGRYVFAIGNNEQATRFSGIAVDRIIVVLFGLSGLFAALAGLIETSRLQSSTPTIATNFELAAITAAVMGGANIFGGEGSMLGTIIAVFIIGLLQIGLALANVPADVAAIAVGALLILSILARGTTLRVQQSLARRRGGGTKEAISVPSRGT